MHLNCVTRLIGQRRTITPSDFVASLWLCFWATKPLWYRFKINFRHNKMNVNWFFFLLRLFSSLAVEIWLKCFDIQHSTASLCMILYSFQIKRMLSLCQNYVCFSSPDRLWVNMIIDCIGYRSHTMIPTIAILGYKSLLWCRCSLGNRSWLIYYWIFVWVRQRKASPPKWNAHNTIYVFRFGTEAVYIQR